MNPHASIQEKSVIAFLYRRFSSCCLNVWLQLTAFWAFTPFPALMFSLSQQGSPVWAWPGNHLLTFRLIWEHVVLENYSKVSRVIKFKKKKIIIL